MASQLVRNEWYAGADINNQNQFKYWKHLVTESIIDLAEDFSKKLYNINKFPAAVPANIFCDNIGYNRHWMLIL